MAKPLAVELKKKTRLEKSAESYVIPFDRIGIRDVPLVGGKNASLGELTRIGIPVPPGFALSVLFYREFLSKSGSTDYIHKQLAGLDVSNVEELQKVGGSIRSRILSSSFPSNLEEAIREGYLALSGGAALPVAVRSSATAEDMPGASFAGQQDTYLNVSGEQALLEHVRRCWGSLWTARAM